MPAQAGIFVYLLHIRMRSATFLHTKPAGHSHLKTATLSHGKPAKFTCDYWPQFGQTCLSIAFLRGSAMRQLTVSQRGRKSNVFLFSWEGTLATQSGQSRLFLRF